MNPDPEFAQEAMRRYVRASRWKSLRKKASCKAYTSSFLLSLNVVVFLLNIFMHNERWVAWLIGLMLLDLVTSYFRDLLNAVLVYGEASVQLRNVSGKQSDKNPDPT